LETVGVMVEVRYRYLPRRVKKKKRAERSGWKKGQPINLHRKEKGGEETLGNGERKRVAYRQKMA